MNTSFTFALPNYYLDYDVKKFAKSVKTKTWAKLHRYKLSKYADKFTTANNDDYQTVGCMLQAAYGVNIGEQILTHIKDTDIDKIKTNIIQAVYY
jgi:hypothetical protein